MEADQAVVCHMHHQQSLPMDGGWCLSLFPGGVMRKMMEVR
jgi:hypothetical protein